MNGYYVDQAFTFPDVIYSMILTKCEERGQKTLYTYRQLELRRRGNIYDVLMLPKFPDESVGEGDYQIIAKDLPLKNAVACALATENDLIKDWSFAENPEPGGKWRIYDRTPAERYNGLERVTSALGIPRFLLGREVHHGFYRGQNPRADWQERAQEVGLRLVHSAELEPEPDTAPVTLREKLCAQSLTAVLREPEQTSVIFGVTLTKQKNVGILAYDDTSQIEICRQGDLYNVLTRKESRWHGTTAISHLNYDIVAQNISFKEAIIVAIQTENRLIADQWKIHDQAPSRAYDGLETVAGKMGIGRLLPDPDRFHHIWGFTPKRFDDWQWRAAVKNLYVVRPQS